MISTTTREAIQKAIVNYIVAGYDYEFNPRMSEIEGIVDCVCNAIDEEHNFIYDDTKPIHRRLMAIRQRVMDLDDERAELLEELKELNEARYRSMCDEAERVARKLDEEDFEEEFRW